MATLENMLTVALCTPMDDPHDENCRQGAPICLWGPPGIGKSGRVEQAGSAIGLGVSTLYLSTLQPEDLSGVPMPDGKGGAINMVTLPQIQECLAAKRRILFLDELTTARPAVQGAGLGVVYTRKVGGRALPGGTRVVAAANPPEEAAGGWDIAPPMANRVMHFDVKCPDPDEWAAWLLAGQNETATPIEQAESIIRVKWNDHFSRISGLGAGFIKKNRAELFNLPKSGNKARGRAWCSPRSWEMALRAMATAEILNMQELKLEVLEASVGKGPCAAWAEWEAYANLPDPKDMLENGWRIDKRRLDITFAALSSATSYALGKPNKDEQRKYAILAWKILGGAVDDNHADLALAPAASLMRAGYTTKAGPDVAAVSKRIIERFGSTGLANYVRKA
jgi:hypothetical protein